MSSKQPEPPSAYSEPAPVLTEDASPRPEPAEIAHKTAAAPNIRRAPCGDSTCLFFPTNADAASYLLTHYRPQVIGFGEAHAQADSTTRATALRFSDSLLPAFQGKASFLLVELMTSPSGCELAKERVEKETAPITAPQAGTNQADYFTLGHHARALGILPDLLRPTCEDLSAIGSSDEAVLHTMETIARLSTAELIRKLPKSASEPASSSVPTLSRPPCLLAYGGALHNDVAPAPDYASWSYGPELSRLTSDKYLEVDLLLPEGLTASPWARFEWFPQIIAAYDEKRPEEAALLERSPRSVALILAEDTPRMSDEAPESVEE